MKRPFYSMRAGVAAQLAFLILLGMLLTNVLTLTFAERDLIKAKIEGGRILLDAITEALPATLPPGRDASALAARLTRDPFRKWIERSGFQQAFLLDAASEAQAVFPPAGGADPEAVAQAYKSLGSKQHEIFLTGKGWGVFWLAPRNLTLTTSLPNGGAPVLLALTSPLAPVYRSLRASEKLLLIYLVINASILTLLGMHIFSRTLVNPIRKLLNLTENYKEGDSFLDLADTPQHEIGRLFKSLNSMVNRLEQNKRDLQHHIESVEKTHRDLTRAQQEIIRSEKLATVGRMAAGLAHEMGNPLGILLGYMDLLRAGGLDERERSELLDRGEAELRRINRIIRQLLDFSRPSVGTPVMVGAHAQMQEAVSMLKGQPVLEKIRVELALEAGADQVLVDPDQLKQVFLNVLMNALDSLEEAMQTGSPFQGLVRLETRNEGGFLCLRVSDNGPGVEPASLPHVFDPFFTTKAPGKGTGLGLSVTFRILESIGGRIRLENLPGGGTTACIDIPLTIENNGSGQSEAEEG